MIRVGIVDNLRILKVEKSDDNLLNIIIGQGGPSAPAADPNDMFAALKGGDESSVGNDLRYIHWPFNPEYFKNDSKGRSEFEMAMEAIKQNKEFFNRILNRYMTKDKITGWNPMAGINFDTANPDNAKKQLLQQPVLDKVYDNQITQFINMLSPHIGESSELFRFKLVRQSKAKHYATLPRYGQFMEPMSVSREATQLFYSKWEIDNGYDKGDPLDDDTSTTTTAPSGPSPVDDIFSS